MKRLQLSINALCALLLFCSVACSKKDKVIFGTPDAPFIDKTLVDTNCVQSLACMDEQNLESPKDWVLTCERALAKQFADMPDSQASFLHAVKRCGTLMGCSYAGCATNDVAGHSPSFGEDPTIAANITFGCQQKAQCEIDQKHSIDMPLYVANCVAATQGTMYTWATDERTAYMENVAMCPPATSCALLTCYKY